MKKLLLLVLLPLLSLSLNADCGYNGIWVFPKGKEISKNSIFMIEGYAASQKIISNLDGNNNVYLQSENHTVKLTVEKINKGGFRLTQAILKPLEKLRVGEEYWLIIDNANDKISSVGSYNGKKNKWIVQDKYDKKKPFWLSEMRPKLVNKSYVEYGCGPAVFAHFQVKINDDSETLVKTEVMDLKNNKSTFYYLTSREEKIDIGHGMCSGAFSIRKDGEYKVRFDLLDASGNSYGKWSEWTKIDNFQSKMGRVKFLNNNLSLQIGVILFLIAVFMKRHSNKV